MNRNKVFPFRNGPAPVPMKVPADLKPYNIVMNDEDDSAEVDMYGEVVSSVPTDWWTGEKVDGLYIALDDFLNDIDNLKNKANVTFHINSPGGEVFAGVSIYNRMKEFTGNVTTIVDGLSASAASIIAQGASQGKRKVCNGSLTMIHGAASFLFGYYNSNDMKDSIKQIDAIDRSIAEIYAKCTGTEKDKVKNMMSNTTWMSAEEAVEKGFADEIVDGEAPVTMSMSSDKNILMVNGIPMSAKGLVNLPGNIPVVNMVSAGPEPEDINKPINPTGGKEKMTLEEIMKSDPELVTQIRNEAIQTVQGDNQAAIDNAVNAEIARLQAIDKIASKIQNKALVEEAKYGETKMSAADLALKALEEQEDAGQAFLNNSAADVKNSGVEDVKAEPNGAKTPEEAAADDIAAGARLLAGIVEPATK